MKFTCETKALSKACQTVARAASTSSNVPALEGIKIEVKSDKATLSAYNLELGIETVVESHGSAEDGAIVLGTKMLCGMMKKFPDFLTTIEAGKDNVAKITSGEAKFEIVGIPASEFPEFPKVDEKKEISIQQTILKGMLKHTLFAVADDNLQPVYTGAYFKVESGSLTIVGLDGYRLAKCHKAIPYAGDPCDFIVPKATLTEIQSLLSDDEDKMVALSVGLRHAIFTIDGFTVITRLLEGEFLDYEQAIPKEHKTDILIDTHEMLQSVERVSLIVSDHLRSPIRMKVNNGGNTNQIDFSCNTALGHAKDSVHANTDGDSVEVGFNNAFLTEALKNSGCEEVELQLSGSLSPMVIRPSEGDEFVFLVLPVRMKSE